MVKAFFALLRAGLWEQDVRLAPFMPIDFAALYALAEEQSVTGLIAAGLEHVEDLKVPKQDVMPFMKKVIALENRNQAMNVFIVELVEKMRDEGIRPVLVKGQGIAQCYARPLWRAAGDVDFLLNAADYEKAKALLLPLASSSETEGVAGKHQGMKMGSWLVELHGLLHCGLSGRIDREIDVVQLKTFEYGGTRIWDNDTTYVDLPNPDNDVIFVFTHFLKHFYKGGIGLRQICDWCRLLWTYRDSINVTLLDIRLRTMRLASEWKAFAAYAVEYLGTPAEAMPLYRPSRAASRKARRIHRFILKVGNFGQNRDLSYYNKYHYVVRKAISFGRRIGDLIRHVRIFPLDSLRFLPSILYSGLRSAARGE